jgi:hypothetical protein
VPPAYSQADPGNSHPRTSRGTRRLGGMHFRCHHSWRPPRRPQINSAAGSSLSSLPQPAQVGARGACISSMTRSLGLIGNDSIDEPLLLLSSRLTVSIASCNFAI